MGHSPQGRVLVSGEGGGAISQLFPCKNFGPFAVLLERSHELFM